jgi:hypothetical protein
MIQYLRYRSIKKGLFLCGTNKNQELKLKYGNGIGNGNGAYELIMAYPSMHISVQ